MKIYEVLLIIGSFMIAGDVVLYLETDIPRFKLVLIACSSVMVYLLAACFYYLERHPEKPNGGAK